MVISMTRGKKLLLLLAFALVVGIVAWQYNRKKEPSYQGRTLSRWLEAYGTDDKEARRAASEAVRHIGANALPFLIRQINYERTYGRPPSAGKKILHTLMHSFGMDDQWEEITVGGENSVQKATLAFAALGTNAAPAIPFLMSLATNTARPGAADHAAVALYNIGGSPGCHALCSLLTNTDTPNRAGLIIWEGVSRALVFGSPYWKI